MRNRVLMIFGALLIVGSTVQTAAASDRHTGNVHRLASQQFRNANNLIESGANASCQNREPGNPYNPQTDYTGWSAWRQEGGWDSRNDCW